MFQLIVAVISIALVAALAIASLYYGGQAFQKSSLKANVTTLVNAGQQISGADALYKTSGGSVSGAANIAALTYNGEYLAALPGTSAAAENGEAWEIYKNVATGNARVAAIKVTTVGATDVCNEVAAQAGDTYANSQFGCLNADVDGGGAAQFFAFKL